jgi:hypothetical protein
MPYFPQPGYHPYPYPYPYPHMRGPAPDYHSASSNSHSNPHGYFANDMPQGHQRPRSVYLPHIDGHMSMYGYNYAHSTSAMGQGSQGDRSQDKSFTHIGTYSYPFNHSYPHPHNGFPRHFIDPMRPQTEQTPFVHGASKTSAPMGVTPVTPGFLSNKNSTPPQFEYPALL